MVLNSCLDATQLGLQLLNIAVLSLDLTFPYLRKYLYLLLDEMNLIVNEMFY